jgi:hypothetical protein
VWEKILYNTIVNQCVCSHSHFLNLDPFFISHFFKIYLVSHKKLDLNLKYMRGSKHIDLQLGYREFFSTCGGERREHHDATSVAVVACRPNNGSGMRDIMVFSLLFFLLISIEYNPSRYIERRLLAHK